MASLGKIARRTFLIGSAAIAGGVAFGAYMVVRDIPNPLLKDLADGEAAITPFVKISREGVTLITPRADKGQGAYSVQAYLIAEELDIDPKDTIRTPGLPDAAYYNAEMMAEGSPLPSYDDSFMAETIRSVLRVVPKLLAVQGTGASSTVPDMYERMRHAGAVARETLKEAAAQRTGIARARLTTENGHVITPDGTRIAYTELAAEAAGIPPVTDVTLRDPKDWRYLGKPDLPRIDMVAKCTGTEKYAIDLSFDGMLFASVCANPGIGGALEKFDASTAVGMPGVVNILEVQAGNAGVAVVATNTWYAFQAVNALTCTWGAPAYPATTEEIFENLEAAVNTEANFDHRQRNDGDVEAALAEGEVFEAQYRIPFLAHAPLEPMNVIVRVTDERLDIWTGTQIPGFIKTRAALISGMEAEKVFVHVQPMGGSFGNRLEMTHVEQGVEIALAMKGTPIKLTWSREEDMTHGYPRPASVMHARGKVRDGRVDTIDISVSQSAMAPNWIGRLTGLSVPGPDPLITTGSWDQPFAVPNYRVTGYRAPDMVPVSSWRSVGASGNGFYHDTFLDELIHEAGADPLEERLRLCLHDPSRKVLEAVGELSGWDGPSMGPNRGRGVAMIMCFGVPVAQVIEVTNTDFGIRLDKAYIAADVGRMLEPMNVEAQLFGGMLFALSHAIHSELTYENYGPVQTNYHDYDGLRLYQTPQIEVKVLENQTSIRGIGEPGVPPAAPALGNAIFAATGQRIREMPFNKHIAFV